mmetsp:Transcript_45530/g.81441  ORF Transcript_45530/g.81441 Transcript_45530/m.81441 type:complete len:181 (-) Transcript_45530:180-722(-)
MENAFEQFDDVEFEVAWRSYMIDPSTPQDGMDYLAYNKKRWGGDGWTYSMRSSARANGIAFADWKWWPHTLQSHRLIQLAEKQGKGSDMKERILVALYEEGKNTSDKEVLIRIGEEAGLPNVREYMMSDEGTQEVVQQDRYGKRELDISGVPFFIINNKHTFSGAQSTDHWVRVIRKLTL